MLSVCLFTQSHEPSGMGQHMLDLAAEMMPVHDVSLLARASRAGRVLLNEAERLGLGTLGLPSPRDPACGRLVREWLQARPVDVFHTHTGVGWEVTVGPEAAREVGVPASIRTQHLPFEFSSPRKRTRYLRTLPLIDKIIAVSDGVRRGYVRLGVPPEQIVTVPNGVRPHRPALTRDDVREQLGLDPRQPVVLTTGRLVPMKGHRFLLEALATVREQHADVVLLLAGDGALQPALAEQARALGIGRHVRFLGHRPDVRDLLPAADVFALPSLHEGHPLAALEAMAAGLPVVGTTIPGTEEIVVDGVTGRLVRPRDPGALARAIARLLDAPSEGGGQGAAGRERFELCFSSARMAGRTLEVYREVLDGVPAATPEVVDLRAVAQVQA